MRYSITEYAYEIQYDETKDARYETFGKTLISYGDQIKDLLGDTDLKPSDMTYVAIADGYEGTVDGKYSAGIFSSTETVTLSAYDGSAPDGQSYAGKWFSNVDGEVSVDENTSTSVTSNSIFTPLFVSTYAAGSYYNGEADGTRYAFDTSDSTGLTGATTDNGAAKFSGNGGHGIANNALGEFEQGTKYVFEADFTYLGGAPKTTDLNAAFIGLLSDGTAHNNNMMVYSYLKFTDKNAQAVTMFNTRFEKGIKYNIAIVYTVGDNSSLTNGTGGADYTARNNYAKANVEFYVNGVKQDLTNCTDIALGYGTTFADDKSFYGFGVYTRSSSYTSSLDLQFDNVYVGPKVEVAEEKIDSYYETATSGTKYSFDTAGDTSAVVTSLNNGSGSGSVTAADGKLTVDNNPTWYSFAFKNGGYEETDNYASGTKYVFEADITYNGGAKVSNTDPGAAFIGFFSTDYSPYKNDQMFNFTYAKYEDDGFNFCGVYFEKGDTKKVTLEYTVGTKTVVDVYVDGVKASSATFENKAANSDSNFFGFGFYCRGTSYTNGLSLTFDNVYLGVVEAQ